MTNHPSRFFKAMLLSGSLLGLAACGAQSEHNATNANAMAANSAAATNMTGNAMNAAGNIGAPHWAAARASLLDSHGRQKGEVTLVPASDGLHGTLTVNNMPPGAHGAHIHAVGSCLPPDFKSAGGHLNPQGKEHGLENPKGAHAGDLPNLIVGADGEGTISFIAHTTLSAIFDADGAAFVVHADADDNNSDPAGNAGPRLLCGVFEPVAK